jgi:hypothetical protein
MENVLLSQIPLDELLTRFKQIVDVAVADLKPQQQDRLLTGAEACQLFEPHISVKSLRRWADQGRIIQHRIGGRVFYKASEIVDAGKTLKRYKSLL